MRRPDEKRDFFASGQRPFRIPKSWIPAKSKSCADLPGHRGQGASRPDPTRGNNSPARTARGPKGSCRGSWNAGILANKSLVRIGGAAWPRSSARARPRAGGHCCLDRKRHAGQGQRSSSLAWRTPWSSAMVLNHGVQPWEFNLGALPWRRDRSEGLPAVESRPSTREACRHGKGT